MTCMRAVWTGALSFGLINIPVRLYSAAVQQPLKFRMLEKRTLCPISYVRICKATGEEVKYEDIVKGFEYEKGDFVVLHEEDFKKANARMAKTIDIVRFTGQNEIDPKLYDKPYYVEPEKRAQKAYALLRDALKKSEKVTVAKMVLRNREHLAVLKPEGDLILLDQLRFADEIRDPGDLYIPGKEAYTKPEIDMAMMLIDQLSRHFDPREFRDEYTEQLQQIIEAKKKGKRVVAVETEPEYTKMQDLMAALKKSLEQEKSRHRRKEKQS